ncbi:MAG TPA: ATP-binding protein, partial [Sphingomicrobium sp.]|nr:ATP-binding protein [Sphingomicrobium sp.]
MFNPFPGLRPFEPDEDHLFFGRESEIDALLQRLRSTRFLSVVGTSGSGKSSLVRSGLIPSLYSGFMVAAGSSWRVAIFRPGEDPIARLAEALDQSGVLAPDAGEAGTDRAMLEATLRRGSLGLVDAVRYARIPSRDNLLIVVDQFEELIRFRRSRLIENSRDEAISFVRLLLEASRQTALPIYVVLTMRSDFIGDCIDYPGLPEAVNNGQYLVPRMTRDQVRLAITGPVAVGGGAIAPRLVRRLLNELGDDQDQLPVLQHALRRTWEYWEQHHRPGEPIDAAAYEAIGTLRDALSLHAEEAYQETRGDRDRHIAEQMFKALTDTFSDPRGVRCPTSVRELADICQATLDEVIEVVEIFRRQGRSFLMPPATVPLGPRSIIDLSHESLMRGWSRLVEWAEQDRLSASLYMRLSQAAGWHAEGAAGLWRNPELELGLRWKRDNRPTRAWGRRHDEFFDRAMAFLDQSEQEHTRARLER